MGRPATGWRTLGILEFIRTPLPAARITTVTPPLTPPRVSGEWARRDPADAFTRMGGIAAIISGFRPPGRRSRLAAHAVPGLERSARAASAPSVPPAGRAGRRTADRRPR